MTATRTYTIKAMTNETWKAFCTRVANEIQEMNCKIVSCDIDPRDSVCTIEYTYTKPWYIDRYTEMTAEIAAAVALTPPTVSDNLLDPIATPTIK